MFHVKIGYRNPLPAHHLIRAVTTMAMASSVEAERVRRPHLLTVWRLSSSQRNEQQWQTEWHEYVRGKRVDLVRLSKSQCRSERERKCARSVRGQPEN